MSNEENNKPCMEGEITQVPLIDVTPRDLQQTLRGTKARFSENIDYNISILAHRLPSRELLCRRFNIGTISQTRVVMVYLGDTANPGIVSEVKDRIAAIKTKTVIDSIYIERNIEDSHLSPFPQVEITQRPDVTESALLQGRIAVVVDGSPDVILAPTTFFDLMDTPDDAYMRWPVAASLPGCTVHNVSYSCFIACIVCSSDLLQSGNVSYQASVADFGFQGRDPVSHLY